MNDHDHGHAQIAGARPAEEQLRARLGIPPEAARVLLFGETSHWDPTGS